MFKLVTSSLGVLFLLNLILIEPAYSIPRPPIFDTDMGCDCPPTFGKNLAEIQRQLLVDEKTNDTYFRLVSLVTESFFHKKTLSASPLKLLQCSGFFIGNRNKPEPFGFRTAVTLMTAAYIVYQGDHEVNSYLREVAGYSEEDLATLQFEIPDDFRVIF